MNLSFYWSRFKVIPIISYDRFTSIKQLNPACKDVTSQCPPSKVALEDVLTRIASMKGNIVEIGMSQGLSEQYCKNIVVKMDKNVARITETIKLGEETMKIVDEEYRKVKTAMMW